MLTWHERQDLGPELADARQRLARFERHTNNRQVIERLRHSHPFHPLFLMRTLMLLVSVLLGLGALAVMVASMADRDIAVVVSRLEAASYLPVPAALGVLAACGLLFALGAHLGLLVFGRSAPLLPHEARQHQRLVADVKQLEATMAVAARISPAPADPRDIQPFR